VVRFQLLTTELLIEKQLGQRRPELTTELYQTWLEVEQRGLKKTPEYRNVMLRGRLPLLGKNQTNGLVAVG
jgi:hypothetical protein